jgi:hypothetical protein
MRVKVETRKSERFFQAQLVIRKIVAAQSEKKRKKGLAVLV